MPTYQITDPNTGNTLTVESNRQPTQQEALNIFAQQGKQTIQEQALSMGVTPFGMSEEEVAESIREQQEIDELIGKAPKEKEEAKLTEKELKQDPKWIESSKKIYQLNEGEDAPKLDSDEQYANYGLRYMGWFNYNLPKMTLEATQLTQATDDQKSAFVDLMDMYDQKQASLKGFGRAVAGLASDPTTYLGIGTFGAATAGSQALKQGIKAGVKEATKAGIKQGAKVGALEGAAYTAADNALRQSTRITAGEQESFDPLQNAKAAFFGGTIGSALGGSLGGYAANVSAKAQRAADQDTFIKQTQKEISEEQDQAESIYDWADTVTGQEVPRTTFSRSAAEKARDELGETTPDVQLDLNLGLNQKIIDVGIEILDALNIPRNSSVQISDQIFDAINLIPQRPEYQQVFVDVLNRNNIKDPLELADLFKIGVSDAGKRLNRLSVASKQLKDIADVISGNAPKETWTQSILRKFGDGLYALDNIRRGLLVSQIATSARNFTAQVGRVGMHTLTNAIDDTLNATFNPIRRLFGKEERAFDHTKTFRLLTNLTSNVKQAKEITDLMTNYYVKEKDRLFTNYASDVADATGSKVFKGAQKVVDGLNTLNRMQEYFYRRGMFATSLEESLKKKGIDLKDAIARNDLSKITQEDVARAVDDALKFTYAKTPEKGLGKLFVDFSNSVPFITTGLIPFGRFMANAVEYQFRHSPLGFTSLLNPKEVAAIAKGDTEKLSQAILGSAILMGAIEAKRRGFGGEKWYELKTEDGKRIDARPYFPLTPYLLVADLVVRTEDGRIPPDAKDVLQGLTGAQFRAGAGLGVVDNLINDLAGVDSEEKVARQITRFVSDVLGGYLTPLRMFGDFINQQQTFRTPLPETQRYQDVPRNVLEQFKTSIPGVRETLPQVESPTRAAPPGRVKKVRIPFTDFEVPGALARQLTGITVGEEKNPAEIELDRLGFKRRDILPYTGDKIIDQANARYLGPLVENVVSILVESEEYQKLNNPAKELVMRDVLKDLRSTAKDYSVQENPERFVKVYVNRLPKATRKLLEGKINRE